MKYILLVVLWLPLYLLCGTKAFHITRAKGDLRRQSILSLQSEDDENDVVFDLQILLEQARSRPKQRNVWNELRIWKDQPVLNVGSTRRILLNRGDVVLVFLLWWILDAPAFAVGYLVSKTALPLVRHLLPPWLWILAQAVVPLGVGIGLDQVLASPPS